MKFRGDFVKSINGVDTVVLGGSNTYTGGDGITITAGDIDVDLTDTVIFKNARDSNQAIEPITIAATGKLSDTFITNGDLLTALTISAAELNQLDGISANVTDTNLNTLTAGSSSDASALHGHIQPTLSFVTGEAINAR